MFRLFSMADDERTRGAGKADRILRRRTDLGARPSTIRASVMVVAAAMNLSVTLSGAAGVIALLDAREATAASADAHRESHGTRNRSHDSTKLSPAERADLRADITRIGRTLYPSKRGGPRSPTPTHDADAPPAHSR